MQQITGHYLHRYGRYKLHPTRPEDDLPRSCESNYRTLSSVQFAQYSGGLDSQSSIPSSSDRMHRTRNMPLPALFPISNLVCYRSSASAEMRKEQKEVGANYREF